MTGYVQLRAWGSNVPLTALLPAISSNDDRSKGVSLTDTPLNPVTPFKPKTTLTQNNTMTNLPASRNIENGFSSSNYKGDNTPIIKSVFLCLSFLAQRNFALCNPIMTVLFWQPFRLVVPLYDTANQLNAVTRFLAVLRDGFTLQNKGITE